MDVMKHRILYDNLFITITFIHNDAMVQQLRALVALQKTQVWFETPTWQLTVTGV